MKGDSACEQLGHGAWDHPHRAGEIEFSKGRQSSAGTNNRAGSEGGKREATMSLSHSTVSLLIPFKFNLYRLQIFVAETDRATVSNRIKLPVKKEVPP